MSWGCLAREKKAQGEALIAFYKCLKGECSEVGISLFCQVTSDKTRENSSKLCQGHLGWVLGITLILKGLSSIGTGCLS